MKMLSDPKSPSGVLYSYLLLDISQWMSMGVLVHCVFVFVCPWVVCHWWPVDYTVNFPLARIYLRCLLPSHIMNAVYVVLCYTVCVINAVYTMMYSKSIQWGNVSFFVCVCICMYVSHKGWLSSGSLQWSARGGGGLYFSVLASWALTWWLYSVGHWKTAFDVTHDCVTCGQCQYCIFKMPVDTFPPRPCAYCLQLWPCVWKDGGPENEVVQFKTVRNDFSLCIFHPAGGLVGNFSLESQSKVL